MHYILVHGGWQAGWCWQLLAQQLVSQGHFVDCIDLPGHGANFKPLAAVTYHDYFSFVASTVAAAHEPVVLVGHSMAGTITAPLLDQLPEKIAHLYHIAAFIPQNGQSLLDMAISFNKSDIPKILIDDPENHAHGILREGAKKVLYHDCPSDIQEWAAQQLQSTPAAPMATPIHWQDNGALRDKRTYIVCEHDRALAASSQRTIVSQYPSRLFTMNSGHCPFLSQPHALATLLTTH